MYKVADQLTRPPKNVVILHGKPPEARYRDPTRPKPHVAGWIGWAGVELASKGLQVTIPAIREPYRARRSDWEASLDGLPVGKQTALITHSFGAIALGWLSDRPGVALDRLVLVAPWLDPVGKYPESGVNFDIDPDIPKRCTNGVDVFYSSKDDNQVQTTMERVRDALPDGSRVRYHDLDYGHFLMGNSMISPEFPELVSALESRISIHG